MYNVQILMEWGNACGWYNVITHSHCLPLTSCDEEGHHGTPALASRHVERSVAREITAVQVTVSLEGEEKGGREGEKRRKGGRERGGERMREGGREGGRERRGERMREGGREERG